MTVIQTDSSRGVCVGCVQRSGDGANGWDGDEYRSIGTNDEVEEDEDEEETRCRAAERVYSHNHISTEEKGGAIVEKNQ